jgi:hypothetical protein
VRERTAGIESVTSCERRGGTSSDAPRSREHERCRAAALEAPRAGTRSPSSGGAASAWSSAGSSREPVVPTSRLRSSPRRISWPHVSATGPSRPVHGCWGSPARLAELAVASADPRPGEVEPSGYDAHRARTIGVRELRRDLSGYSGASSRARASPSPPAWEADDPELIVDPEHDEDGHRLLIDELRGEFADWAELTCPADGPVARSGELVGSTMLDWKATSDGQLGRWTRIDLAEFLLDWLPREVALDEAMQPDVVDCVIAFLRFLDDRDSLSASRSARSRTRATSCAASSSTRPTTRCRGPGEIADEADGCRRRRPWGPDRLREVDGRLRPPAAQRAGRDRRRTSRSAARPPAARERTAEGQAVGGRPPSAGRSAPPASGTAAADSIGFPAAVRPA